MLLIQLDLIQLNSASNSISQSLPSSVTSTNSVHKRPKEPVSISKITCIDVSVKHWCIKHCNTCECINCVVCQQVETGCGGSARLGKKKKKKKLTPQPVLVLHLDAARAKVRTRPGRSRFAFSERFVTNRRTKA